MIKALYEWQTLAAGLLAILSALVGGYFVVGQTSLARQQEATRLSRRFNAARSVLPLALSYLSAYARATANALKAIYRQRDGENIPYTIHMPSLPRLPTDVIGQLRDMVEADDGNAGVAIAEIISEIQVQTARITELEQWPANPESRVYTLSNIEDYILDAAEIYARAAALFDFARRKSDSVSIGITKESQISSLNQLGFYAETYPRLHERIKRRNLPPDGDAA